MYMSASGSARVYDNHAGSARYAASNGGLTPEARTITSPAMSAPSSQRAPVASFRSAAASHNSPAVAADSSRTTDAWLGSVLNMNSAAPTGSCAPRERADANSRNAVDVGTYMHAAAAARATAPIASAAPMDTSRARSKPRSRRSPGAASLRPASA